LNLHSSGSNAFKNTRTERERPECLSRPSHCNFEDASSWQNRRLRQLPLGEESVWPCCTMRILPAASRSPHCTRATHRTDMRTRIPSHKTRTGGRLAAPIDYRIVPIPLNRLRLKSPKPQSGPLTSALHVHRLNGTSLYVLLRKPTAILAFTMFTHPCSCLFFPVATAFCVLIFIAFDSRCLLVSPEWAAALLAQLQNTQATKDRVLAPVAKGFRLR
jgi:hypothetical protein